MRQIGSLDAAVAAVVLAGTSMLAGCGPRFSPGESNFPACTNGGDDDGDGLADCADPDCAPFCGGTTDSGPPATCGNGQRDGAEACDGPDLGPQSCITLGFTGGTLACTFACTYDTGGCTTAGGCGDGTCAAGETCSTCAIDCGTCCGNAICEVGESAASCPADCGGTGVCGDGVCDVGEAMSCPFDCMGMTGGPGCVATTTPGCGGCVCESCVCMFSPTCCSTAWDATCATFCTLCGQICM